MIVLPPAFPYGGMENPTLTFLTPTFLAGDRSLVGLVAHELAHSWSGNLVTNATWADGWLNEGFTSYFENRIMEALYGPRARRRRRRPCPGPTWRARFEELGADRARHPPARSRRRRRRRRQRHRLRQGRDLPAHDRADRRPRAVRRLAALLFRPPRLPADDLGPLPRRPARQPGQGRRGAGAAAEARRLGLPARPARQCRAARSGRLRRGRRRRCARSTPAARAGAVPYARLDHGRAAALPQRPAARAARGRGSPSSTAPSACRRAAMPRCCSPGCSSRSPTATSRRCRRPSASCWRWAARKFVAPLFETLIGRGRMGPADRRARSTPAPAAGYHSVTTGAVDRLMRGES